MKRSIASAAVAVSLVAAMTACSGSSESSSADEFTMWSMWSKGEPNQVILAGAIKDFEKDTGIKVNVVWKGRSPVAKLLPALNTSKVPADLVDSQNAELVNQLGKTGNASDLSSIYDEKIPGEDKTVGEVINPSYRPALTTDSKVYMVPHSVITYSFFYNQTRFPEIASNPPATWDDLESLFAKSKAAGKSAPIALEGSIPPFSGFWTTALVLNSMGPGSFRAAAGDKTGKTWLEPGYVDVANKLADLVKNKYFIDDYRSSKYPAVQQEWASDKADFMYNGTWIPVETTPYASKDFKYGSFAFPVVGSAKPVMQVAFNGFAVVKKSKKQESAKKFISYFLQKKYQDKVAIDAKGIPARTDIKADGSVAEAVKTLNSSETVIAGDNVPWDDYLTKVFQPINDKLFAGDLSGEEFAKDLSKRSADYWASTDQ